MAEQYGIRNAVHTTSDRQQSSSSGAGEGSIWSQISAQITRDSTILPRPDMSNKSNTEETKPVEKKPAKPRIEEEQKAEPKEEAKKDQCSEQSSAPRFGIRYAILTEQDMAGMGGYPWNGPRVQSAAYRPANGDASCGSDTGRSTAPNTRSAGYRSISYK